MQRKNKNNEEKIYGTIVTLSGERTQPFGTRLCLGYDCRGYPVYEFLDTFQNKLDAELCRRDYSLNPYNIIVNHEKYNRIVSFSHLPSSVIDESTIIEEKDRTGYTFKQVYEEWKEIYFPTPEQIKKEEDIHERTPGKFSKSNMCNLRAAFNNSKKLHDKSYTSLRKLDFEFVINETKGCRSKRYNLLNLFNKLDEYALEKDIISKGYAQFVNVDCPPEEVSRTPYSYNEIDFLWTLEGNIDVDILLVLLYNCMRIEELLKIEVNNVDIENWLMTGGLKTENGKERIIPVHSRIRHIILRYYNKDNKYLFTDENGNKIKYNNYSFRFRKFKDKYQNYFDKKHVIHETRHSARSEMDRHSANKKCMDLLMGHKSKDVGERVYNHKTIEELRDTIELITYKETKIFELGKEAM